MNKFYYEFDEHEYYGLIAVSVGEYDFSVKPYKKAAEIYVDEIGGESVEELLEEGHPNLRTKEYAFMKFMYAPNTLNLTVGELIKDFESVENGTLLIDGNLI